MQGIVMNDAMRKKLEYALIFIAASFILFLLSCNTAYADTLEMKKDTVIFNNHSDFSCEVFTKPGSVPITGAKSTNKKVVEVRVHRWDKDKVELWPWRPGHATIVVQGKGGLYALIHVKVTRKFIKKQLRYCIKSSYFHYGDRKLHIYGYKGMRGSLKIKNDIYRFKARKYGFDSRVRLKKIYPLNTKVKVTLRFASVKVRRTLKCKSDTYLYSIYTHGKFAYLGISCLHKGDKVKFKYKGRTATRRIKKTNSQETIVTVKSKRRISKSARVLITVTNKYNQTLLRDAHKLKNGYYDEDEGDGMED